MRQFLYCEAGYVEKNQWLPNSWVNVECPTPEDLQFLMDRFNVPESFLSDIADTDERPRIEYEGNWLLTILRIPLQNQDHDIPFNTVPIGIITNNEIIVSVCYHKTDLIPDFIRYTQRKELQIKNKYELILRLIHSSAVWFLKYLKQINYAVTEAEKALEKSIRIACRSSRFIRIKRYFSYVWLGVNLYQSTSSSRMPASFKRPYFKAVS